MSLSTKILILNNEKTKTINLEKFYYIRENPLEKKYEYSDNQLDILDFIEHELTNRYTVNKYKYGSEFSESEEVIYKTKEEMENEQKEIDKLKWSLYYLKTKQNIYMLYTYEGKKTKKEQYKIFTAYKI